MSRSSVGIRGVLGLAVLLFSGCTVDQQIERRVTIDHIEIGEPVTIGVGVERIGSRLVSIGDSVTIAVGVQGIGTGLVLTGVGETILICICIAT